MCDPRLYLRHQSLAIAWLVYNSASGRFPSDARIVKLMERQSAETLYRMLAERNALPKGTDRGE